MGEFVIRTDQKSLSHLSDQRFHTPWQQMALTKLMVLHYRIEYRKGVDNRAAEALSCRPHQGQQLFAISSDSPIWLQQVIDSNAEDDFTQAIISQLVLNPCARPKFQFAAGIRRKQERIWVGADTVLQTKIV